MFSSFRGKLKNLHGIELTSKLFCTQTTPSLLSPLEPLQKRSDDIVILCSLNEIRQHRLS